MHLLPLRQVSICRDSLSPAGGDTQGADCPCSCGDSGFVSPGCLALSSYPLRVGGAVTATPGAAGWEAVGRAKGGGWRTGTEPLIPLLLISNSHRKAQELQKQTKVQINATHRAPLTHQHTGRPHLGFFCFILHLSLLLCSNSIPPPISTTHLPHIQPTHTVEAVRIGCVV